MSIATSPALRHPKNLWSYNPLPTGCVFYYPTWHPNLSSSVVKSVDSLGHTITTTGALYKGKKGRWFDGAGAADDVITVTARTSIANIFAGGGTMAAWLDVASDGEGNAGAIFDKDTSDNGWYFIFQSEAASKIKLQFLMRFTGGGGSLYWNTDNTVVTINTPTFVAITYNSSAHGNTPIIYIGEAGSVTTPAITKGGTGTGTNKDDSAGNLTIGNNVATTKTTDGYMMECWGHTKICSAEAITHLYQQTRGRHE